MLRAPAVGLRQRAVAVPVLLATRRARAGRRLRPAVPLLHLVGRARPGGRAGVPGGAAAPGRLPGRRGRGSAGAAGPPAGAGQRRPGGRRPGRAAPGRRRGAGVAARARAAAGLPGAHRDRAGPARSRQRPGHRAVPLRPRAARRGARRRPRPARALGVRPRGPASGRTGGRHRHRGRCERSGGRGLPRPRRARLRRRPAGRLVHPGTPRPGAAGVPAAAAAAGRRGHPAAAATRRPGPGPGRRAGAGQPGVVLAGRDRHRAAPTGPGRQRCSGWAVSGCRPGAVRSGRVAARPGTIGSAVRTPRRRPPTVRLGTRAVRPPADTGRVG